MRIRIHQSTQYAYDEPIRAAVQILRTTPRPNDSQHITQWRVETDADARLKPGEDAFGNITHALYIDGAVQRLRLTITGEVETSDTGGVLRGGLERLPVQVFLRETPLTVADVDLRSYAADLTAGRSDRLDRLHVLLAAVHNDVSVSEEPIEQDANASKAFAQRRGGVPDLAHVFISAARHIGVPARYVSGHLFRQDEEIAHNAAHAWVEAHVEGLGWVGFDPVTGACPTDAYVRVACALDFLGAAPIRGARFGGGKEQLDVSLSVAAEPGWRGQ
jgi:transglutaminase-like putative cysteine protease